jgi:putative restriction endonuclease
MAPGSGSDVGEPSKTWLLSVFGNERQYGGNTGYEDDLEKVYYYDSHVQNHKQVAEGDLALFRDRRQLLGIARIARISSAPWQKERLTCPSCGSSGLSPRRTKRPKFRCSAGHEFDEPARTHVACTRFEAHYAGNFLAARELVPISKLREACPKYTGQLSMQILDLSVIEEQLMRAVPGLREMISGTSAQESSRSEAGLEKSASPYLPSVIDTRVQRLAAVRLRQGQSAFRAALRERYGDICMISGCDFVEVLEAAHISPFRGESDNHVENGLLLRADLHVLFDLDLLGIEPDSLQIALHPSVARAGYASLARTTLRCGSGAPSRAALVVRWASFQTALRSGT